MKLFNDYLGNSIILQSLIFFSKGVINRPIPVYLLVLFSISRMQNEEHVIVSANLSKKMMPLLRTNEKKQHLKRRNAFY